MKYLKLFESFEDIKSICKKYGIENYTINDDGSIDVDGDVNLYESGLSKIPFKFRNVSGYFYCSYNKITSLEGYPTSVGGHFNCSNNQITSLEGCPESVGGDFICNGNTISEIWNLFNDYDKIELFNDYDIIRGDTIILDRLNDFLEEIGKPTVTEVEVENYKII